MTNPVGLLKKAATAESLLHGCDANQQAARHLLQVGYSASCVYVFVA